MSENVVNFLWLWTAIIIANQIFIFGACFAPYCITAALPHTLVLALFFFFGYRKFIKRNS
ncbi:hypothetical protein [Nitrosococcus halophilus]|uniref:hypothetical protein n=1 Tax=Nitrosococcus halophilus TaxID=133539 RepID=UPI0009FD1A9F|nr:hypothetical protein [Nitrosococcus halophilus]